MDYEGKHGNYGSLGYVCNKFMEITRKLCILSYYEIMPSCSFSTKPTKSGLYRGKNMQKELFFILIKKHKRTIAMLNSMPVPVDHN